jgi:anti-sigma factor RsiW
MNRLPCQALDDYLAHDVAGEELTGFTAHLADCPACARAVREQRRLEGLLTEATARLEPLPAGLTRRVADRVHSARLRRLAVAAVALLAAAAAVVAWMVTRPAVVPHDPEPRQAQVQPEPPPEEASARVRFPTADVVVVREELDQPNVTFLWVYPGLRTAARPAEESVTERSDP